MTSAEAAEKINQEFVDCGWMTACGPTIWRDIEPILHAFAEAVRAEERERCAVVCERLATIWNKDASSTHAACEGAASGVHAAEMLSAEAGGASRCAKIIRLSPAKEER